MDGLIKVAAGITTIEELTRVVYLSKDSMDKDGVCPSCSKIVMLDTEQCPHCGQLIKSDCKFCGKPLQQDWIICPFCATRHNPAPSLPARLHHA